MCIVLPLLFLQRDHYLLKPQCCKDVRELGFPVGNLEYLWCCRFDHSKSYAKRSKLGLFLGRSLPYYLCPFQFDENEFSDAQKRFPLLVCILRGGNWTFFVLHSKKLKKRRASLLLLKIEMLNLLKYKSAFERHISTSYSTLTIRYQSMFFLIMTNYRFGSHYIAQEHQRLYIRNDICEKTNKISWIMTLIVTVFYL